MRLGAPPRGLCANVYFLYRENTTYHMSSISLSLSRADAVCPPRYHDAVERNFGEGGAGDRGGAPTANSRIGSSFPTMPCFLPAPGATKFIFKYMYTFDGFLTISLVYLKQL
jgi:hypothetical protein